MGFINSLLLRKTRWLLLFFALLLGGIAVAFLSKPDPVVRLVERNLALPDRSLWNRLSAWEERLGAPETVMQEHDPKTFYYWPHHGVAVLCDPSFAKQFQHSSKEEWDVTHVYLPLNTNVMSPDFGKGRQPIIFSKILLTKHEMDEMLSKKGEHIDIEGDFIIMERPWKMGVNPYD